MDEKGYITSESWALHSMRVFPHSWLEKKCAHKGDGRGQDGSGPPVPSHGTSGTHRKTCNLQHQAKLLWLCHRVSASLLVPCDAACKYPPERQQKPQGLTAGLCPGCHHSGPWLWAKSNICFYNCSDLKHRYPCSPLMWLHNCQHEHRSVKWWFP